MPISNVRRVLLSHDEYHADKERISASGLKIIAGQSLCHFKNRQEGETEESDALIFGGAYHCFILERNEFYRKYAILDEAERTEKDKNMASNKNKEWKAIFLEAAASAGQTVITRADYETIKEMRNALYRNRDVAELLTGGETEVSFHFDIGTLQGKCRFDYVRGNVAIDLKTTKDASPREFGMDAYRRKYHIQAAFYSDVLTAERGEKTAFYYIAQEKKPPYISQLYVVSDAVIERGRTEYLNAIEKLQAAVALDYWPAYEDVLEFGGARELFYPNFKD